MSEAPVDKITIFGMHEAEEVERGFFKKSDDLRYGYEEVQVPVLEARLSAFVADIDKIVQSLPEPKGGFRIESITVSAEISPRGSVSLLGTGGEVGGRGGLTLTLRRAERAEDGTGSV